MFKNISGFVKRRKILSLTMIALIIGTGYYFRGTFTGNASQTSYLISTVEKGTITSSVSGAGQVSAESQTDIMPKASGEVTGVYVKAGEKISAGATIAQIDSVTAQRTVRDAKLSLETAQIAMEKLKEPTDELSLIQAQNALTDAQNTKQNAIDDMDKAYDDAFTAISNAFLDLPTVVTGIYDILFKYTFNSNQQNISYLYDGIKSENENALVYKDNLDTFYQTTYVSYNTNFDNYKTSSRFSDTTVIESLLGETYDTTKTLAEVIKDTNNFIQLYKDVFTNKNYDIPSEIDTFLTNLETYTATTNDHLSKLLTIKTTIKTTKQTIEDAERTIQEKTEALADAQSSADELDIRAQEISVQQKQNSLNDAEATLSNYTITAPYGGVIATVDIEKGDTVSTGTAAATIITNQKIAEISLNEVDISKVEVGQKATLTFDAIEDLEIAGEVAEIDTIGTVTQGVVTYNVKIIFDTQDDTVKPGMSVNATIITEAKTDILLVPNNAIKTSGDISYVEMLNRTLSDTELTQAESQGIISTTALKQVEITTGVSNDNSTEVLSGLEEGAQIIIKTTTIDSASSDSASTTKSSSMSLFGGGGGGSGGPPPGM
ncbi:MAG: efflux RND transporter periplasmic adaptor subunit [Candidatus Gracilibacteria bacterium]|jgi:HlyD family secretion protein